MKAHKRTIISVAIVALTLIIAMSNQKKQSMTVAVPDSEEPRPVSTTVQGYPISTEEQSAVREDILERAAQYAEADDYKMAIAVLRDAENTIPADKEISDAIDEYLAEYRQIVHERVFAVVREDMENKEYADAIDEIKTATNEIGKDVELSALYDKCAMLYRENVEESAKVAYKAGNYEEAISLLRKGTSALDGDEELACLVSTYQNAAPIPYFSLVDINSGYDIIKDAYNTKKEKFYDVFFPYWGKDWWTYDIMLDGQYKRLSGTLIWDLAYIDSPRLPHTSIIVHGDGKDLLVTSVDCESGRTDFEVDLTGIIYLSVSFKDIDGGHPVGVANFNLYKEVIE